MSLVKKNLSYENVSYAVGKELTAAEELALGTMLTTLKGWGWVVVSGAEAPITTTQPPSFAPPPPPPPMVMAETTAEDAKHEIKVISTSVLAPDMTKQALDPVIPTAQPVRELDTMTMAVIDPAKTESRDGIAPTVAEVAPVSVPAAPAEAPVAKKKGGRVPGSKNKPKDAAPKKAAAKKVKA
jgi:hypothetical protein